MILDTCALLWLASGAPQLNAEIRGLIEAAPDVGVSSISAFEIGQKYQKGKLRLPTRPSEWFETIIHHHQLSVVEPSAEICLRATELPEIHKDPFDRLIIATALTSARPVVTSDPIFKQYGIKTFS